MYGAVWFKQEMYPRKVRVNTNEYDSERLISTARHLHLWATTFLLQTGSLHPIFMGDEVPSVCGEKNVEINKLITRTRRARPHPEVHPFRP